MATRVVVHGHVQGVFFRASTRNMAERLGLTGWVRNDPAGSVTAHLEGARDAIEALLTWIRAGGPDEASVSDVDTITVDDEGHKGFRVRH